MKYILILLALSLSACTDHSRNFEITVRDCGDVVLELETLVEKVDNTEESTNTPELELEVPLPI